MVSVKISIGLVTLNEERFIYSQMVLVVYNYFTDWCGKGYFLIDILLYSPGNVV